MIRKKFKISDAYKEANISLLQDNLAALRAKAAISQEELANLIGVSRQTYYGIETGKKEMSWTIFIALIFFFYMLKATKGMIDELRIFPVELFLKLNESL